MQETKRCPLCAEEIQAAAVKCKHCGQMLNAPSPAVPRSGWTRQHVALLAAGGLLALLSTCAICGGPSKPTADDASWRSGPAESAVADTQIGVTAKRGNNGTMGAVAQPPARQAVPAPPRPTAPPELVERVMAIMTGPASGLPKISERDKISAYHHGEVVGKWELELTTDRKNRAAR